MLLSTTFPKHAKVSNHMKEKDRRENNAHKQKEQRKGHKKERKQHRKERGKQLKEERGREWRKKSTWSNANKIYSSKILSPPHPWAQ